MNFTCCVKDCTTDIDVVEIQEIGSIEQIGKPKEELYRNEGYCERHWEQVNSGCYTIIRVLGNDQVTMI